MKIAKLKYTLWVVMLLCSFSLWSQQRATLKELRRSNQNEIAITSSLLEVTNQSKEASLNKLLLLNKQIKLRKDLVLVLDKELIILDSYIEEASYKISTKEHYLKVLISEYEQMLKFAFISGKSHPQLMFVLASGNFNQAYLRVKYLSQLADYREQQMQQIIDSKASYVDELAQLSAEKEEKKKRYDEKRSETQLLVAQITKQKGILLALQKSEKNYLNKHKNGSTNARYIDQTVSQAILASEQAINLKPVNKEKVKYNSVGKYGTFPDNKGNLSWPVKKGVITGYFGTRNHPFLARIKVMNNGIDISTPKNAKIYPVYQGKVAKVVSIPGANNAILIAHGDYYTLYSNLSKVHVNTGDTVSTTMVIGNVFTDSSEDDLSLLQFQVWYKTKKLNPVYWIKKNGI